MYRTPLAILFLILLVAKTTNAQTSSFIFTTNGDFGNNQGSGSNFTHMLQGIKSSGSAFHLAVGDFAYSTGREQSWSSYVKSVLGPTFPFELLSGNHESGENCCSDMSIYLQNFPHRINNITTSNEYGKQYYFDYPNTSTPVARFIMISPDLYAWDYFENTARYNWVKNAILDARNAQITGHPIPWVIVGMHKTCITNGTKRCEIGEDLMNLLAGKNLGPNNTIGPAVDLVLQAHDHMYTRSKQLKVNATTCPGILINGFDADCVSNSGPTFIKGQGTVINIVGVGGQTQDPVTATDPEANYFAASAGLNSNLSYGYMKFTVDKSRITANFVPTDGTFTDNYSITAADLTVTPTSSPTPGACLLKSSGDATCDSKIDLIDFEQWRKEYMATIMTKTADFNSSGIVDLADFEVWRKGYFNAAVSAQTIVAFGDAGATADAAANVNLAVQQQATGYIGLGDNNYGDGPAAWRNVMAPLIKNGCYCVQGNHDPQIEDYIDLFPNRQAYWSASVAGVRVIGINTEQSILPNTPQWTWLNTELANAPEAIKVLAMHRPWWIINGSEDMYPVNSADMDALMTKYNVSLVLAGHKHNYHRKLVNNIHYVVVGTGGAFILPLSQVDSNTKATSSEFGQLLMKVSATNITANFLNLQGVSVDSFTVQK